MLKGKFIVVGVSAGIASYKSCYLVRLLIKAGAEVQVIMTENATEFISPLTFESLTKHKCLVDTFDRSFEYKIGHIAIADRADCFVIAPASADAIAKVANGFADSMLSTTFLACSCPKLIVPAMNDAMYKNPITQDNLQKCTKYGICVMPPENGSLACGRNGIGKMPEPDDIFERIDYLSETKKDFAGKKILVTAGCTKEALDPVRFISNHSTGKMGYAIAKGAAFRGASVTLVSGPTDLKVPPFVNFVPVISASDMAEAVKSLYKEQDIIIKAAAVADYTPAEVKSEKIKKADGTLLIELKRTEDILAFLGKNKGTNQFICGFSMETEHLIENSRAKLEKKNIDMIVANNIKEKGAGFAGDTNAVTFITKDKEEKLPLMTKAQVASCLLDRIRETLDF